MGSATAEKGKKMADLIDREALIAEYDRVHVGKPGGARKLMEKAPAVDAVPVVRCKDCKQFMEYTKEYKRCVEGADGDCRIRVFHSGEKQFIACKYSDFCSYGERKDNGT